MAVIDNPMFEQEGPIKLTMTFVDSDDAFGPHIQFDLTEEALPHSPPDRMTFSKEELIALRDWCNLVIAKQS